ncbi:MAG: hypothetical protein Q8P17_02305 [bacterium]|nr:hypothetical protein [bacterium]
MNLRVFLRPELRSILDAVWFPQVTALLLIKRDVAIAVFGSNSTPGFVGCYNGDLCGLGMGQCVESEDFACSEAALVGTLLNRGATMRGTDVFLRSFPDLQWSYVFALAGIKRLLHEHEPFDPAVKILQANGVKVIRVNR